MWCLAQLWQFLRVEFFSFCWQLFPHLVENICNICRQFTINIFTSVSISSTFPRQRVSCKKGIFTVRLTKGWTLPPQKSFLIFFRAFDLRLWLYVLWNRFYTQKTLVFIQLRKSPFLLTACCCSVTKWSDSGIAEVLRTWKMHFSNPSRWDEVCFEYQRIKFHICLKPGPRVLNPKPNDTPPSPPHFWKIMLQIFYNGYGRIYAGRHRPDIIS